MQRTQTKSQRGELNSQLLHLLDGCKDLEERLNVLGLDSPYLYRVIYISTTVIYSNIICEIMVYNKASVKTFIPSLIQSFALALVYQSLASRSL